MEKFLKKNDFEESTDVSVAQIIASCTKLKFRNDFLDFIEKFPDHLDRTCQIGHLTGSSLVVREKDHKILLMFHTKLQKWLQPGGHADGDPKVRGPPLVPGRLQARPARVRAGHELRAALLLHIQRRQVQTLSLTLTRSPN